MISLRIAQTLFEDVSRREVGHVWTDAINSNRIGCLRHTHKSTYLNNVLVNETDARVHRREEKRKKCSMRVCGTETRSVARSNDKKRKRMLVKKKKEDFLYASI